MIIEKILYSKIIGEALDFAKKEVKGKLLSVKFKALDIHESLDSHNQEMITWSDTISFKDMVKPKSTKELYIDLDVQLTQKKELPLGTVIELNSIHSLLANNGHNLIILGDPGAGKTTSMKRVCQMLLNDPDYLNFNFPILLRLRQLDSFSTIYEALTKIFGISLKPVSKLDSEDLKLEFQEQRVLFINKFLDQLGCLIILDGLDEVSPLKLNQYLNDIEKLFLNVKQTRIVLTCRSGSWNYTIPASEVHEICYLDRPRIKKFCENWFEYKKDASKFMKAVVDSPYGDTAVRPLTLALLCALFDKYQSIPDKPKSVYKKIILLLIEEWDSQRRISRKSKFDNFQPDIKFDFLSNLAFSLSTSFSNSGSYSEADLKSAYSLICSKFALPKREMKLVISEIESHSGLFLQSGYDTYEFAHKSLQEYLIGEYLVRLNELPSALIKENGLFNELAVAASLASDPNDFIAHTVFKVITNGNVSQAQEFFDRLILEKPDFSKNPVICIAIIEVYSKFYAETFSPSLTPTQDRSNLGLSISRLRSFNNFQESIKVGLEKLKFQFPGKSGFMKVKLESKTFAGKYYPFLKEEYSIDTDIFLEWNMKRSSR